MLRASPQQARLPRIIPLLPLPRTPILQRFLPIIRLNRPRSLKRKRPMPTLRDMLRMVMLWECILDVGLCID